MRARLARGLCREAGPDLGNVGGGGARPPGRRRQVAALRDAHRVPARVMAQILGVPEHYLRRLERTGVISRAGGSGTYDLVQAVRQWGALMARSGTQLRPAGAPGTVRALDGARGLCMPEGGEGAAGPRGACAGDGWPPIAGQEETSGSPVETLWRHGLNILSVPDHGAGMVAMGHFIGEALAGGERAVLVGFNHPDETLAELSRWGMEFDTALAAEQLIYLYYKPNFSHSLSFATDYLGLLAEISRLANGDVSRIAFCNVDALFNVQSTYLATASIGKLLAVAGSLSATLAGYFVSTREESRSPLEEACASLIPGYLVMHRQGAGRDCIYSLVNRTAGGASPLSIYLKLVEEHGFVDAGHVSAAVAENTFAAV